MISMNVIVERIQYARTNGHNIGITYKINQFRTGYFCPKLVLIHKHEKKDFKMIWQDLKTYYKPYTDDFIILENQLAKLQEHRFTIYSGLLYPVDVYPYYPANHSWRRYKVETLLAT